MGTLLDAVGFRFFSTKRGPVLVGRWCYPRWADPDRIRKLIERTGFEASPLLRSELSYRAQPFRYRSTEQSTELALSNPLKPGEGRQGTRRRRLAVADVRGAPGGPLQRLLHRCDCAGATSPERHGEGAVTCLPYPLLGQSARHLRQSNHYRSGICDRCSELVLRNNRTLRRATGVGTYRNLVVDRYVLTKEVPDTVNGSALVEMRLRDHESTRTRREVVWRGRATGDRVHAIGFVHSRDNLSFVCRVNRREIEVLNTTARDSTNWSRRDESLRFDDSVTLSDKITTTIVEGAKRHGGES